MKVLYLLRYYPTLSETFVYREIRELVENHAVEVSIASLGGREDGSLQQLLPAPNFPVPRARLGRWMEDGSQGSRFLRKHQRRKDAARLRWLRSFSGGFDLVHAHFAGEAAEFAHALWLDRKIPYTVTVHATGLFRPRPSLGETLGSAAGVAAISSFNRDLLASKGITSTRIPCGIDLDEWPETPLHGKSLRALFVGRYVAKKGLDLLCSTWNLPKQHQLRIISSGEPSSLPDGALFLGPQPTEEVRRQIRWCNLLVLPCIQAADGDMDGIPVVLMEAMASGRAVMTSDLSGIPELVDSTVGWLLPPGDQDALASALNEATDMEILTEKAKKGRSKVAALHPLGPSAEKLVGMWRRSIRESQK
jgi:colanic acid/amylovoran biosynthesis glycosyltransferase